MQSSLTLLSSVLLMLNLPSALGQTNRSVLATQIFAAIDSRDTGLRAVNREIFEHPELGFDEVYAHKVLTEYLEEQGFNVTRSAYGMPTAFRAQYSNGEGRVISFNAEYDALPGMGHACGHNLIATVGVAAAIGAKEALGSLGVTGKVVLLGTPAEEAGGGKVKLLKAGAYDGLVCSLMAHPVHDGYKSYARTLALWRANITWKGVSAHAALAPHTGKNALDGFVAAYGLTGLYRQQLMPTDRIHHVVVGDNGLSAGVIPDNLDSHWGVRGTTRSRRDDVVKQLRSIIQSSGSATATNVTVTETLDYWDQVPSFTLAQAYHDLQVAHFDPAKDAATANYTVLTPEEGRNPESVTPASTDQGNVSWFLPAIQVEFPVGGTIPIHNPGFRERAGSDFAYKQAIITAKLLALTGLEVLRNETFAKAVQQEFEQEMAGLAL